MDVAAGLVADVEEEDMGAVAVAMEDSREATGAVAMEDSRVDMVVEDMAAVSRADTAAADTVSSREVMVAVAADMPEDISSSYNYIYLQSL